MLEFEAVQEMRMLKNIQIRSAVRKRGVWVGKAAKVYQLGRIPSRRQKRVNKLHEHVAVGAGHNANPQMRAFLRRLRMIRHLLYNGRNIYGLSGARCKKHKREREKKYFFQFCHSLILDFRIGNGAK
jgi:hypothetical protein